MEATDQLNPANSNNFQVVISGGGNRVDYWARMVTLPGFSMPSAPMQFQNNQFSLPSNSRDTDNLQIEFLLSEDMSNWMFFRRWHREGIKGSGPIQNAILDVTVIFMSSIKLPVWSFKYLASFPTNMSQLTLEHGIVDTLPPSFSVSFNFTEEVVGDEKSGLWDNLNEVVVL